MAQLLRSLVSVFSSEFALANFSEPIRFFSFDEEEGSEGNDDFDADFKGDFDDEDSDDEDWFPGDDENGDDEFGGSDEDYNY